jgi:purine operon repressor
MRAGGTAKGMADLVKELDSNVSGIAVLIETLHPKEKMVKGHISILILDESNKENVRVFPSEVLLNE